MRTYPKLSETFEKIVAENPGIVEKELIEKFRRYWRCNIWDRNTAKKEAEIVQVYGEQRGGGNACRYYVREAIPAAIEALRAEAWELAEKKANVDEKPIPGATWGNDPKQLRAFAGNLRKHYGIDLATTMTKLSCLEAVARRIGVQ